MIFKAIRGPHGLRFEDSEHAQMHSWLTSVKEGSALSVDIKYWDENRSRQQQNLLHELIGRYSRANFEPLEVCKMRFKIDLGYYIPASTILSGEVDLPKWRGKWADLHAVYPELHEPRTIVFVRSEADYTKPMEREFIEYALDSCQGSGVYVEDILHDLQSITG